MSYYPSIITYVYDAHNNVQEFVKECRVGDYFSLISEKNNNNNKNEIIVFNSGFRKLGYLSRSVAKIIAPFLDKKIHVRTRVREIKKSNIFYNYLIEITVAGIKWSEHREPIPEDEI